MLSFSTWKAPGRNCRRSLHVTSRDIRYKVDVRIFIAQRSCLSLLCNYVAMGTLLHVHAQHRGTSAKSRGAVALSSRRRSIQPLVQLIALCVILHHLRPAPLVPEYFPPFFFIFPSAFFISPANFFPFVSGREDPPRLWPHSQLCGEPSVSWASFQTFLVTSWGDFRGFRVVLFDSRFRACLILFIHLLK